MQFIKRVIQAAKDRALVRYSALVRLMLKDADASIAQILAETYSSSDQRTLRTALEVLRGNSSTFLSRMENLYQEGVERGMRTMYTDLRQGLRDMSADRLSLIDDETVNRQLEVGNLVQRLRDACDENLGRLNIMIAQIHGDPDVHERENPFRPYLHAKALYDALREKTSDEDVSKILFEHLANSLASHLSDYYASICEVFDSSGIQAKLLARPTQLKKHQRDQLAAQLAALNTPAQGGGGPIVINAGGAGGGGDGGIAAALPEDFNQRVLPTLERMLGMMEKVAQASGTAGMAAVPAGEGGAGLAGGAAGASPPMASEAFQDFVWKIFNQAQPVARHAGQIGMADETVEEAPLPVLAPASPELLTRLDEFQQVAASGQAVEESITPDQNQLFALGEKLDHVSQDERVAVDVVAVLFEFILEDEQIPAALRLQIGRLQIPFLKAAMLDPGMLQNSEHPARKLLNRMSSTAVGLDPETAMGKELNGEISRLVRRVLQEFSKDVGIFTECLEQLEHFLEEQLKNADAETAKSVEAAAEMERISVLQLNTAASLRELLASLNPDQRISDFILDIWSKVLVRAATQDVNNPTPGNSVSEQYRDVLPELVWSGQQKQTPQDRTALMKLLPSLVKRLKIGMLMIHLPADESKIALDSLVGVHTDILRGNPDATLAPNLPKLDELRQEFSRLVVGSDTAAWTLTEPPQIAEEVVESVLADSGASAEVEVREEEHFSRENYADLLSQLQLGTSVSMHAADTSAPARLIWISKHQSLYIFKMDQNAKPLIYSTASLVKALRDGAIRLSEYAPVFDRAVDSLMLGAEALQAARQ